jgi:hypothetical protein
MYRIGAELVGVLAGSDDDPEALLAALLSRDEQP